MKILNRLFLALSLGIATTTFSSMFLEPIVRPVSTSVHGFPLPIYSYVFTGSISSSGYSFIELGFLIDVLFWTLIWLLLLFLVKKLVIKIFNTEVHKSRLDGILLRFITLTLALPGIKYAFSEDWNQIPLDIHQRNGQTVDIGWIELFLNIFSWIVLSFVIVHIVFYLKRLIFNKKQLV